MRPRQAGSVTLAAVMTLMIVALAATLGASARRLAQAETARAAWRRTAALTLARSGVEAARADVGRGRAVAQAPLAKVALGRARGTQRVTARRTPRGLAVTSAGRVVDAWRKAEADAVVEAVIAADGRVLSWREHGGT